jgi:CDP-glucose 4,6-dehydratase
METVVRTRLPAADFWRGQRVFVTGHTGFKGGWAALWLRMLGAEVCGYSLPPPTKPSMFEAVALERHVQSHTGDVRDLPAMRRAFEAFEPTVVLHMAAQALVRASYADPAETYSTNVMGTVNVLELARTRPSVTTLVVTTDKVYENREQIWAYREIDRLGGRDPYSSSKACAEMVTTGYWWSYFSDPARGRLGSARAGNVIGGGDWSSDRLVPDLVTAFAQGRPGVLRRPESVRPWQHVLEAVCGYLLAIEDLNATTHDSPPAWNFAPDEADHIDVRTVASLLAERWGEGARIEVQREATAPHEASVLTIDTTKAKRQLGWAPRWPLPTGLAMTADWYKAFHAGGDVHTLSQAQIRAYEGDHG